MTPVTSKTALGVFSDVQQAHNAVAELRKAGFPESSIGMMIRHSAAPAAHIEQPGKVVDAEIGAAAGAIGGVALALIAGAIPAAAPIIAVGPLMGGLGGAGLGAVAGLIGTESHDEAATAPADAAVVTVHTENQADAAEAQEILHKHGLRDSGYRGNQPGLEPLSEDEIRRERDFYAAPGHRAAGWQPENERERSHAGDEPGTVWPHEEAHDIGEDLVDAAAPPPDRKS